MIIIELNPATPPKINMEPENTPLEEENHLNQSIIFRFSFLIFRGVQWGNFMPSNILNQLSGFPMFDLRVMAWFLSTVDRWKNAVMFVAKLWHVPRDVRDLWHVIFFIFLQETDC